MLGNLALVARLEGDDGRALALSRESLALFRELEDMRGIASALLPLARAAIKQGDSPQAAALYQESLTLYRAMGDRVGMAAGLEGMAQVACGQGHLEQAARFFGAAEALREVIGVPVPPSERADYERTVAVLGSSQAGDTCAVAWAAGRALPLEQAIADALAMESLQRTVPA